MSASLQELVLEGLSSSRLIFPASVSIIAVNDAISEGSRWFSESATSEAVATILTNDPCSVQLILGAIAKGVTLVSLPLPGRGADPGEYLNFISEALQATGTTRVVARDDAAELLDSFGIPAIAHSSLNPRSSLAKAKGTFGLIQYTSGSTAKPKAIQLSGEVLAFNIQAILERVEPGSGDVTVSWLPLSHDMGLIGMLLTSLAAAEDTWTSGSNLVLLEPERFLRQPSLWMNAVHHWRGTFTASPDFGLRIAASRTPTEDLDLGCIRHVIVGGEIVRPATLRAFEDRFRPTGLSEFALAPAYGLAELGLAASMTGPHERWHEATVDVLTCDIANGDDPTRHVELAASGRPLTGYTITADPATSAISIRTAHAGVNALTGRSLSEDGAVTTGDVGLIHDGQLFVVGRNDDIIVINGRNLFAPAVEQTVSDVPGVRAGRVIARGTATGGWIVEAERDKSTHVADPEVARAIRAGLVNRFDVAPDEVRLVPPGQVRLTASGKVVRGGLGEPP